MVLGLGVFVFQLLAGGLSFMGFHFLTFLKNLRSLSVHFPTFGRGLSFLCFHFLTFRRGS